MGKVSHEARTKYAEKSKEYKAKIQALEQKEKKLEKQLTSDNPKANFVRLELTNDNLDMISCYVLLNSLSLSLLGVKNEAYLNNARKCCYKSIIYLEEIVTNLIDAPFSEYEDKQKTIAAFDDLQRYNLVRKLGYSIQAIEDEFGANSKWKWSFVELQGRFATVAKNLIDLKGIVSKMDPRVEGYPERVNFLDVVKRMLELAANRYREKYELSTRRLDDMKLAINYLCALKRILSLTGQPNQIDVLKKKIDAWNTKMEADLKKQDEELKHRMHHGK